MSLTVLNATEENMVKVGVDLTGVKQTLFITLLAKAAESQLPDSLLHDEFARRAANELDIDTTKIRLPHDGKIAIAVRAKILDDWTRQFLNRYSDATVLHLGCGLDSRFYRLGAPATVRWFNVDFPDVIQMREQLYPDRPGVQSISASITEPGWLQLIPVDRPIFVLSEGVFPYFHATEVQQLFDGITTSFPQGEIAFDSYPQLACWWLNRHRSIQSTGAKLKWWVNDPRQVEKWNPRLKLVEVWDRFPAEQLARFSMPNRLLMRLPVICRMMRLLRFQFSADSPYHVPGC
ncbi:class I SAM-dependent methyltransferase [Planctomicrobium sp. SH527]|uniref:class I SAM-dependent methyltransferase n=1 Tax=Planctomicrobium sp. SH527 TaxID=3448123 RepID=UPI003F5AF5B3